MVRGMHPQQPPQQYGPPPGLPGPPYGQPPKKTPNTRLIGFAVLVGALAVLVLLVFLLGGNGQEEPTANASPTTTLPAAPRVPTPDGAERDTYLAALRAVDPGLVEKEERAVDRGRNTCLDILERKTSEQVTANAKIRFTGEVTVSEEQALQIVEAVKAWCR